MEETLGAFLRHWTSGKHQGKPHFSSKCLLSSMTSGGKHCNLTEHCTLDYYPQALAQLEKSISTHSKSPDNPGPPWKQLTLECKHVCHSSSLLLLPTLSTSLPVFSPNGWPCLYSIRLPKLFFRYLSSIIVSPHLNANRVSNFFSFIYFSLIQIRFLKFSFSEILTVFYLHLS